MVATTWRKAKNIKSGMTILESGNHLKVLNVTVLAWGTYGPVMLQTRIGLILHDLSATVRIMK